MYALLQIDHADHTAPAQQQLKNKLKITAQIKNESVCPLKGKRVSASVYTAGGNHGGGGDGGGSGGGQSE